MITLTIIICLTVILIVAIICYKEYKLINNDNFNEIRDELRLLRSEFEINGRILSNIATSISYLDKEEQDEHKTPK